MNVPERDKPWWANVGYNNTDVSKTDTQHLFSIRKNHDSSEIRTQDLWLSTFKSVMLPTEPWRSSTLKSLVYINYLHLLKLDGTNSNSIGGQQMSLFFQLSSFGYFLFFFMVFVFQQYYIVKVIENKK
jgi:hypothetical protein